VSDEFTVPLCRGHHREPIALAMKPHGGKMLASINHHCPHAVVGDPSLTDNCGYRGHPYAVLPGQCRHGSGRVIGRSAKGVKSQNQSSRRGLND
jgi:hypothetical protein